MCSTAISEVAASVASDSGSHSALVSLIARCDGTLLTRLGTNLNIASSNIIEDVSSLADTLETRLPDFVSNARRHFRVIDKRLEMIEEEFDSMRKTLQSFVLQLGAAGFNCDPTDSCDAIRRFLKDCSGLPNSSIVITSADGKPDQLVREASNIMLGVDPGRSLVTHPALLVRGELNAVTITALGAVGEPVWGIVFEDVTCGFESEVIGWELASVSVPVTGNAVTVEVAVTPDGNDAAVVCATIAGALFRIHLKVSETLIV